MSWSGKKKINSYKLLSIMDHSGWYIYARVCLGKNDREVLMSSPLYLQEGDYFSEDGFMVANFDGDGIFHCSYKNPGNDKVKQEEIPSEFCVPVPSKLANNGLQPRDGIGCFV
jgi:hypothetical protein